jgi:hypothetical protein
MLFLDARHAALVSSTMELIHKTSLYVRVELTLKDELVRLEASYPSSLRPHTLVA